MRLRYGYIFVFFILLIYTAIYWLQMQQNNMGWQGQLSYYFGILAAILMAIVFILAVRPRFLEKSFGGLDRMYKAHKYMALLALLFLIFHYFSVPEGGSGLGNRGRGLPPIKPWGIAAGIGFVALIIIALYRKIPYNKWLLTHRFMGLFYAIIAVHIIMAFSKGKMMPITSAPAIILLLFVAIGLAAFIYKLIFYHPLNDYIYRIADIQKLENATEVILEPQDKKMKYRAGQFAFLTIQAPTFYESHPFTITSAPKENKLRFTIKVLGDYTQHLRHDLSVGLTAIINGPYGLFDPIAGTQNKIWIAGGVGIAPFLSCLRALPKDNELNIYLYYCICSPKDALFISEIRKICNNANNIHFVCLYSDDGEFLTAERIMADVPLPLNAWEYYLCGPKPMIKSITTQLKNTHVHNYQLHTEEFDFR